ncbi:unnamed protein product [Caenorhabditis nigoni]
MPSTTVTLLILLISLAATVISQYAYNPQFYSQFAQQQRNYYSNPRTYYNSPVYDNLWGAPANHGWSQVRRHHSPQYAPVYGK